MPRLNTCIFHTHEDEFLRWRQDVSLWWAGWRAGGAAARGPAIDTAMPAPDPPAVGEE